MGSKLVRSIFFFHIFGARKKIRKKIFQEKSGKIGFFSGKIGFFFGKNRDLSEIIGIFPKNRRFFAEIFLIAFSMDFSSPLQPITEKSAHFSDFLFPAQNTFFTNATGK